MNIYACIGRADVSNSAHNHMSKRALHACKETLKEPCVNHNKKTY